MRIFGDFAQGWAEAAALWRATVEAIVHHSRPNHDVAGPLGLPLLISSEEALAAWPGGGVWRGVLLGDTSSREEAGGGRALLKAWGPAIAILSDTLPRRLNVWLAKGDRELFTGYAILCQSVSHDRVGGVTEARRSITHFSRLGGDMQTGSNYDSTPVLPPPPDGPR